MSIYDKYKLVINNLAQAIFHKETITWYKLTHNVDRYGEGENQHFTPITLRCLIDYNWRRTWPINIPTSAGLVDGETICVIFNLKYLKNLGYTDVHGYPTFNLGQEYFSHMGIEYTTGGDTQSAQAGDDPLLFQIILKRKTLKNG